ncbi:DUF58 domain-containing protein [Ramlibacter sp. 2FC]|uniref:DUF58 domain-containing protein n=1 Tax=Ramlibacter sp. 2FC TaxID=2502188 RepID=UPI0010F96327|nr:DUF58 domain-containing protein [Ramlibacter sp. 2FC]
MKAARRLREGWRRWWLARLPATDTLSLTQRNVYILPTRAGWMLAATLAVLLVASINYQLNLGYLLTFLLAGSALASMHSGHATLRGLTLHLAPPPPCFAGSAAELELSLSSERRAPRHAIGLGLLEQPQRAWTDVPAQGSAVVHLGFTPAQRGPQRLPALCAETRFPLGVFHVWTLWRPAAPLLVYPAPEFPAPPLPPGQARGAVSASAPAQPDGDFDGVRSYRRGDPLKRVVWKKFARADELVSRDSPPAPSQELWLDWEQAGPRETEARLSRLCAWVLAADRLGLSYGLRLPGQEIAPAAGEAHKRQCLEALARC